MWFVLSAVVAFACPEDPVAAVRGQSTAMEEAFSRLDEAGFDAARPLFEEALACVATPLGRDDVMAIHRGEALIRFVDGDMRSSIKCWAALKAIEPGFAMPAALSPSPLIREHFDAATPTAASVDLDLEPPGGWLVDGVATSTVPVDRAFVLQARDEDGVVYYTGHQVSVAEVPIVDLVEPSRVTPKMRRVRAVGSAVAGAFAVGALAGLGVYVQADATLDEVPYGRIDATAVRGNTGGGIGAALGVAAVGVFTVSWAGRW